MAKLLKLRLGVSDDPTALQPSLNDCLEVMLQQSETLIADMIEGLVAACAPSGPRRIPAFQQSGIKQGIMRLSGNGKAVALTFKTELTRLVYEGGGKEQVQAETLRFEDLQLFADEQLDQSIEVARAQQEVLSAVDDSLPALDALVSTLLGWRTIQPGLNPLRPDVFVRALQSSLAEHVPQNELREILIAPAAGILGVNLRKLYRELADWLRSTGVEPAVPLGGRVVKGSGASGSSVTNTVAKTLLTLDKLRKLLAGDFDSPPPKQDFLYTVPASMAMLHDQKQVDALVKRLEQRPKAAPPPAGPVDMLAQQGKVAAASSQRIGEQLGEEVVRLMFDNLAQDARLLPAFKRQLRTMETAVHKLAKQDSRFFSDRNHPARQVLERITQRSLAFKSETDPGWPNFLRTVEDSSRWLDSKVVDADTFCELLDNLHKQWGDQDQGVKHRREEAAKALLHAEQRNLLAQKLGAEFLHSLEGLDVADFIRDFLKNSWAQVVAQEQLACTDGTTDPHGYRALVDDLIWSVQKSTAQRGRARRLVQMIPGLLAKLREGLARLGYPPELTTRFFDHLITLHRAAVQEGRDAAIQAAADKAWAENTGAFSDSAHDEVQMWLDQNETHESGFVAEEDLELDFVSSPLAAQQEAQKAEQAKANQEKAAQEKAAHGKAVQEKLAHAKAAQDKAAQEQAAQEKAAREQAAQEKAARGSAAEEKVAREKAAQERAAQDKAAQEKAAQEAAQEKAALDELVRMARERAANDKPFDQAADAKAALEKAARDKLLQQKAERARVAKERAEAERGNQPDPEVQPEPPEEVVAQPEPIPASAAPVEAVVEPEPEREPEPVAEIVAEPDEVSMPLADVPARTEDLRTGSWVEIQVKGAWVRAQLTWCSPHATLFMFTSITGTAHSMSKRTMDKLRATGQLKVVADRNVVDEALDQVAQAALKNSLDAPKE